MSYQFGKRPNPFIEEDKQGGKRSSQPLPPRDILKKWFKNPPMPEPVDREMPCRNQHGTSQTGE
jgi:hypothetical protein